MTMISLAETPSSPMSARDGQTFKQKYLQNAVAMKFQDYMECTEVFGTCEWNSSVSNDGETVEFTCCYEDANGDDIDFPCALFMNPGRGQHSGIQVDIDFSCPNTNKSHAKRLREWCAVKGLPLSFSIPVEWTGFTEDDQAIYIKHVRETLASLSRFVNGETSEVKRNDAQSAFVERMYAEITNTYGHLDMGEICLDVCYAKMVGIVAEDGHMVLEPVQVKQLASVLEFAKSFLETMVDDAGTDLDEAAPSEKKLDLVYAMMSWCELATERAAAHGGE